MELKLLKLTVKKDVLDNIVNNGLDSVVFEATPFYMSKFTTSKKNTVEEVLKDKTLMKEFDSVEFMCSGDRYEFELKEIDLIDDETPVFTVTFFNLPIFVETVDDEVVMEATPEVITTCPEPELEFVNDNEVKDFVQVDLPDVEPGETIDDTSEVVLEDEEECTETCLIEDDETCDEGCTETCPVEDEELNVEYEEMVETEQEKIKSVVDYFDTLNEFLRHDDVYQVRCDVIKISYGGRVVFCDKVIPHQNEHNYLFEFDTMRFEIKNLKQELNKLTGSNIVFIDPRSISVEGDFVNINIKTLYKLDLYNLM